MYNLYVKSRSIYSRLNSKLSNASLGTSQEIG